ncbi:MAG: hypothetical protein U0V56_07235 [Actinomycetota bacterium]
MSFQSAGNQDVYVSARLIAISGMPMAYRITRSATWIPLELDGSQDPEQDPQGDAQHVGDPDVRERVAEVDALVLSLDRGIEERQRERGCISGACSRNCPTGFGIDLRTWRPSGSPLMCRSAPPYRPRSPGAAGMSAGSSVNCDGLMQIVLKPRPTCSGIAARASPRSAALDPSGNRPRRPADQLQGVQVPAGGHRLREPRQDVRLGRPERVDPEPYVTILRTRAACRLLPPNQGPPPARYGFGSSDTSMDR